ncbi:unnamed protein product [Allacma fusca]|uniref:Tubulin--tyrosine ligase-like protein 9 n=1 Tax=Allacma fusca TaxID=39272 RepID=A0A8J2L3A4_9HEXA|nr:unnamed protein product [Allacma fusca]
MELWDTLIYPGMKKAILGVLMASHESLFNTRKNAFELYGADFMLADDLSPWLIEINSVPLMSNATETYRKMSSQVMEDTVKVIFDRQEKPNADTGMFELIYKQNPFKFLPVITPDILIRGKILQDEDDDG